MGRTVSEVDCKFSHWVTCISQRRETTGNGGLGREGIDTSMMMQLVDWAIPFNIRTPSPVEDWPFPLTPKEFHSKVLTPEDFLKKWVYPWRISQKQSIYPWRIPRNLSLPLKNSTYNMGFTPKEFPSFWSLPLKNSTTLNPYTWRIPLFLNRGGCGY